MRTGTRGTGWDRQHDSIAVELKTFLMSAKPLDLLECSMDTDLTRHSVQLLILRYPGGNGSQSK